MNHPDMTRKMFEKQCEKYGFKRDWLGYYQVSDGFLVHPASNAGPRLRDQLAFMIRESAKNRGK